LISTIQTFIFYGFNCAFAGNRAANCDFVIFPESAGLVVEDTFRPPWFHQRVCRNYGFVFRAIRTPKKKVLPRAARVSHNQMSPAGPDAEDEKASNAESGAAKLPGTMARR